jgi:ribosomal protein L14E/L6E/L27E
MSALTNGTICRIVRGRRAGERCVLIASESNGRVKIITQKGQAHIMSALHLFPLPGMHIDVSKTADAKAIAHQLQTIKGMSP